MSTGTITRDGPPPTFTFFPTLPTELQIKIWRYTLLGPRIIQLQYSKGSSSFHSARPPPALYTYRTSREVALSVFEPAFTRNDQLGPIYIDFAHDTLHLATNFEMCKHMASLYPDFKEKIQSLAVEISKKEDLEKQTVDIGLSHLSNLREIIFVVRHAEKLLEFKYAECVRFSKPKAIKPFLWQR
ncbi:uncharacterized protein PAC_19033 [Phialocephala subalpina]|uniref:2EXR domain-containing protein n=1 Tax=Phialocephala subalpina TaxID=576137 RepID=A0A1L7XVR2_9HELO|nr:uncharacterized protein PAC_19033 [Phialocephala subalpina]